MKKRLRPFGLLFIAIVFSTSSIAQQKKITGKVADPAGKPLSGVTVSVKHKTVGTTTNENGDYNISASNGDVLLFTFIGFTDYEERVGSVDAINVTLKANVGNLNEVVVVGYGLSRKKDLTGAVATVSSKDFQTGVITTPEQLIAGKIAGVSIISNSGQPGAGSTIVIRGGASLSASNSPLIVIDGVPVDNDLISGATNSLSFVNANDIESFSVLKDASASAIYGTRASNGVIIITSKRGRAGALKLNFSTVNSLST